MAAMRAGLGRNKTVYVAQEDGCARQFIHWKGVQRRRSRSKLWLKCRQGFLLGVQVSSVGSSGERKQESCEPHGKSMAEIL